MAQEKTPAPADKLIILGTFEDQNGAPIAGAAVHERFLGDPPSNCGTYFDLVDAPEHTDDSGQFQLVLSAVDEQLSREGPPGIWRRGCFLVLAVKDARTIGYIVASGEELQDSPIRLKALPVVDIKGRVVDLARSPICGARVEVDLYLLFVGRGPYPNAPVNFWLSVPDPQNESGLRVVDDLAALTDANGLFTISKAPAMPGQLRLNVSHSNFATLETDYYPYQPLMQMAMQPGAAVRIRLQLPEGKPAAGFKFILEGEAEGQVVSTHRDGVTDEAGLCELGSLPPGSYTIRYLGGASRPLAVPAIHVPDLLRGEGREISLTAVAFSIDIRQTRV